VVAEACFGPESFGLSGSPFVQPPEPVDAIAVGTWTQSVAEPTVNPRTRMRVTSFKNFGAIAL
jgi:hypothetical protein